jgi:hypothetical protein
MRCVRLGLVGGHCSCGKDGAGVSNEQEARRSGPRGLSTGQSGDNDSTPQWKGSIEKIKTPASF